MAISITLEIGMEEKWNFSLAKLLSKSNEELFTLLLAKRLLAVIIQFRIPNASNTKLNKIKLCMYVREKADFSFLRLHCLTTKNVNNKHK